MPDMFFKCPMCERLIQMKYEGTMENPRVKGVEIWHYLNGSDVVACLLCDEYNILSIEDAIKAMQDGHVIKARKSLTYYRMVDGILQFRYNDKSEWVKERNWEINDTWKVVDE